MSKFLKLYEEIKRDMEDEAEKWSQDVNVKKGKMRRLLNVPADKKLTDVYTSGQKLAKDLLKAIGDKKEVSSMLAYAANIDSDNNVLDRALHAIKSL